MQFKEEFLKLKCLAKKKTEQLVEWVNNLITALNQNEKFKNKLARILRVTKITLMVMVVLFFIFVAVPALQEFTLMIHPVYKIRVTSIPSEKSMARRLKQLEFSNKILERKISRRTPPQPYLIVNSTENILRLYAGKKLIRESICSTGSYIMLQATDERRWIFKTPRGVFRIQGKTTSPVWIKPDWAFIEEGLPVPPSNAYSRYEYGVLGDYALSLGHGYLIHGTLYQRFLGMPVTHGCIRLSDDDLKAVYYALNIGSKVFIY